MANKANKKGLADLGELQAKLENKEAKQEQAIENERKEFALSLIPNLEETVQGIVVDVQSEMADFELMLKKREAAYMIRQMFFDTVKLAKEYGLQALYDELEEERSSLNSTSVVHGIKIGKAPNSGPEFTRLNELKSLVKAKEQEIGVQVSVAVCKLQGIAPISLDEAFEMLRAEDTLFNNKENN